MRVLTLIFLLSRALFAAESSNVAQQIQAYFDSPTQTNLLSALKAAEAGWPELSKRISGVVGPPTSGMMSPAEAFPMNTDHFVTAIEDLKHQVDSGENMRAAKQVAYLESFASDLLRHLRDAALEYSSYETSAQLAAVRTKDIEETLKNAETSWWSWFALNRQRAGLVWNVTSRTAAIVNADRHLLRAQADANEIASMIGTH